MKMSKYKNSLFPYSLHSNVNLPEWRLKGKCYLKGTLMQIWRSPHMFVHILKQYTPVFEFLILRILELFTCKIRKMFVYKHTETIEYVKK